MATMANKSSTRKVKVQDPYYIPVPRRSVWRRIWRFMMRLLALFFIDADVHGRKNFPRKGPVIIVANHTAFLEVAMIQAFAPYPIEFLTTGDIPLEPRFAFWANLYGFIPVKRGSMDRKAMSRAVSVLEQGGVVGLFPQGGIWDTKVTQARTGVAWLSQKGNATVVPIGFGGTEASFVRALRFQRPRITMNVGEPIPPLAEEEGGGAASRKDALEDYTERVMKAVFDLIPQWEKDRWHSLAEEHFELVLEYDGAPRAEAPAIPHADAAAMFFHRPVLLDAMRRNLALPVGALEHLRTEHNPQVLADALDAVLHYVVTVNDQFLPYRFGRDMGKAMIAGLTELRDTARWAATEGLTLNVKPIRRYRMENESELTVQEYPPPVKEL